MEIVQEYMELLPKVKIVDFIQKFKRVMDEGYSALQIINRLHEYTINHKTYT